MKLYLSSYHLGNNPERLTNLIGKNKRIAVIPNALDVYTDIPRRQAGIQREIDDLISIGLIPEELDLRVYFSKPDKLRKKLQDFGAVWVMGGNTFALRRAYNQSGLDTWLLENKLDKDFVYAGYSAGVCILSPELRSIELIDEPYSVPDGYKPDVIWEGLGLVNVVFAPHYRSDHPESEAVEKQVEYLKEKNIKYMTLKDGDVIISQVGTL